MRKKKKVCEREERMHYFQDDVILREEIQRFVIMTKRRRCLFETREKTCLRLRHAREHNIFRDSALHLIRSLACKLQKIHKTDTTAPSSEFTCLRVFFFLFSFSAFYIQKHSTSSICTHRYAEVFFNQEYREYINFSSGIAHFYRVAFPCFFFF